LSFYSGADEVKCSIAFVEQFAQNTLICPGGLSESPAQLNWLRLSTPVYASTPQKTQVDEGKPVGTSPDTQQDERVGPVSILQSSFSSVGSKIMALELLWRRDAPPVDLLQGLPKESLLVTLIDLTRHSDLELSYKASRALIQSDSVSLIRRLLTSPLPRNRDAGRAALLHLDEASVSTVLVGLPGADQILKAYPPTSGRRLVPTASPQGDRYYVRVRWDPTDSRTVDCLGRLFSRELTANRTIDEETELVRKGFSRLLYWYDKGSAIRVSGLIVSCGGVAEYVRP
jgi:hypothetical protein